MYIKFILVCEKKRKNFVFYFPSLYELHPFCTVCYWSFWCMEEYRQQHIAEPLKSNQLLLVLVVLVEEDGSHWGPEVLAGAGHL